MELESITVTVYLRHALMSMTATLDRFDDESVNRRPHGDRTNSAAALVVHACSSATYWFEHAGLGRHVERNRDSEFEATATVDELRELLSLTAERLTTLAAELDSGPTTLRHESRARLHEGDTSDGSLVLHVMEELFQHLGHLQLTADAISSTPRGSTG